MASKSNMTLRIEPELKEQAAALFKSLGLDFKHCDGDILPSSAALSWPAV